jgi:hypothetical protein
VLRKNILLILIIGFCNVVFATPGLLNPVAFTIGSLGKTSDSLENIADRVEDSVDKVHDKADRIRDSIQEAAIGPEGRDLRFSLIFSLAHEDNRWLFLPTFGITKRMDNVEFGLHEVAFNQSDPDASRYFLTLSPSVGLVPLLTRPLRFSGGVGSSFQIIFRNYDSFAISPFIYFSGTVFYQKRISSTFTLRGRHTSSGGFLYISKKHHEINNSFSWLDLAASIDFYF